MVKTLKKLANVLLVDDSKAEVTLVKEALRRAHIHLNLFSVPGGEEAIHYLHKEYSFEQASTPDLILLDLNMPNMDGKEVLSLLKKDSSLHHIPVVIYSGSDSTQDIEETKKLGATYYMTKVISPEKLHEAIAHIGGVGFQETSGEHYLVQRGT